MEKERALVGLAQVVKLIRRCVTFEVSDRVQQSFANDCKRRVLVVGQVKKS